MSLALVTSALGMLQPRTAGAEGRTPLRLTAEDVDTARRGFTDLLAQSRQSGQRLADLPGSDEHARSGLGAPLPVAMIRLDRLRAYQAGAPADDLIDHLGVVLYPVQVGGDVRAELELAREGTTWQAVRVGASAHARELSRFGKVIGAPAYLVRVPALGVELLAYGSGATLRLALVHATPGIGLAAGRALPAQDVLNVLVPLARAYQEPVRAR
jgi:hypothetical protein